MSSTSTDITELVLRQSDLPRDVEAIRKKCLTLPMVSACKAELSSFNGHPIEAGRFHVDIAGSIHIETRLKVGMSLAAIGTGEIDSEGQALHLTDVKITNDFSGIISKILSMTGLVAGRSLRLRPGDSALIRAALTAGTTAGTEPAR